MLIGAINVRNKVSDLQSKLSHAAKQSLDRPDFKIWSGLFTIRFIVKMWFWRPGSG